MKRHETTFHADCAGLPLMIVGNYGSGKTEVAVHIAAQAAARGEPVSIVDLDLVNPYFRCREARAWMEQRGVDVVVPPPRLEWADLPILLPEVPALLHPAPGRHVVFDVGGDDVGARVLASLHCALGSSPYELWQVINARRPFTDTVGGCLKMLDSIESASRLKVTGLVANTHLM
ncbi:MAG: P-loop NTPase family protein, partial [Planctomycetota bacterium]